jgi:CDP-4-dehydro-6-deoxyglucose reductase/ferredoxin-NAD(P)+ reductase (naphthalene dioxygenase ferredoxin-specific)
MALSAQFNDNDKNAGTVTSINRIQAGGAEIYLIRIRPPKGFSYKAGQYVDIGFGKLTPRSYSIANAPGEPEIVVHIKRAAGEASLFIASVLRVGDNVSVSPAKGSSTFDPNDKRPLLIIAGGMGFTPVKAVAEAAVRRNPDATVHFFWGAQNAHELYMSNYFEDMAENYDNFHFHPVTGTPVGDVAMKALPDLSGFRIFIAGPPAMVVSLLPRLITQGADAAAISYDAHNTPPAAGTPERKPQ